MKILCVLVLASALWEAKGYPYAYPYYGANVDSISYGSVDSSRGGMALSRYYNPYYPRSAGTGMAAFMFQPENQYRPQPSQYYLPDRKRQAQPEINYQPQQNEVFYPQVLEQSEPLPEQPIVPEQPVAAEQPAALPELPVATEPADIPEPTEKTELITSTVKSVVVPELAEPELESEEVPKPAPQKRVTKRKQVKRPVDDDEEEIDDFAPPRMPAGAFFPMFFGWGGRSGGGAPSGGATAIANALSTGRGGVATSHATAYGPPKQDSKVY